jgi:hypothetical protein
VADAVQRAWRESMKILIIDDNPHVLDALTAAFQLQ